MASDKRDKEVLDFFFRDIIFFIYTQELLSGRSKIQSYLLTVRKICIHLFRIAFNLMKDVVFQFPDIFRVHLLLI